MPYVIQECLEAGRSPFAEWFDRLDAVTAARIDRAIRRRGEMETLQGNKVIAWH